MSPETTLEMIYRWLLEGKKIRHNTWREKEFLHLKNGMTYNDAESPMTYEFEYPDEWELYQEPKEKVKWYQVIAYFKTDVRPIVRTTLFKSEQDFLDDYGFSKEDFHFIKLIEIDYQ